MKKRILPTIIVMLGFLANMQPALSCSLALDANAEKDEFISNLAAHFGLPATSIQREDLTKPNFTFLAELGADCSGLDRAIITSAFNFTAIKNFKRCTYKGVVIRKAESVPGEYFVNAENPACVPFVTIPPVHLPVPRFR